MATNECDNCKLLEDALYDANRELEKLKEVLRDINSLSRQ